MDERAKLEVFLYGHAWKHASRLGHNRDAALDDLTRVESIDALAAVRYCTLRRLDDAQNGLHRRGFAGGVAAQEADDPPRVELVVHALEHVEGAVVRVNVVE